LLVVLYGYETWFLTLREESGLGVFDNKVLRKIFGPMRDVTRNWRRLVHCENVRKEYFSLPLPLLKM
jgi:hypothetical protein